MTRFIISAILSFIYLTPDDVSKDTSDFVMMLGHCSDVLNNEFKKICTVVTNSRNKAVKDVYCNCLGYTSISLYHTCMSDLKIYDSREVKFVQLNEKYIL